MSGPSSPGAIRPDAEIRRMFGRIVRRYDLMNRLMTGGRDGAWRDHAAREALAVGRNRVLDLATGTGDLAFALARAGAERVVGVDFAEPMIRAAEAKRGRGADRAVGSNVAFLVGDAMRLPFADGQFDAATVSFGLRNMKDYAGAIAEVRRVLRPGGRFVCLELTPFRRPVAGRLFNWYFTRLTPLIGGLLSGDRAAYRYLPVSVAAFPDAAALAALMRASGFARVEVVKLGGGTVALHIATA